MSMFGFLAYIMGPLMKVMYMVIPSYAITIIVFTILVRLLSFPLAIKQQKSMAKMSVFTPMMNEIQQKYKNNQQKQQEELMRLQEDYGYNPTAGCMPMLVNMLVLFGVIEVVYKPLKYILSIPTDIIKAACDTLGIATNSYLYETQLIQAVHNGAGLETGLSEAQLLSIQNFNTRFLGLDICSVPELKLSWLLIFPILATVTMIISQIVATRMSGQQSAQQGSMKMMLWFTNAFFAYFCFTVPIGFSIYYTISNLCMLVQSIITGKIYSPERYKAEYEAEIAAKKAERKKKKAVTVVVDGKEVDREVGLADYNKLRLERARAMDAEKYKDERTTPLNKEA